MKIYFNNYRGFRNSWVDTDNCLFLTGDNSSGKSSLLYLLEYITKTKMENFILFPERYDASRYDFFSPYCDNKDVTIGFEFGVGAEKLVKVATIKKSSNGTPFLQRFTYFRDGTSFSLGAKGTQLIFKHNHIVQNASFEEVVKAHHLQIGFKTFRTSDKPPIFTETPALISRFIKPSETTEKSQNEISDAALNYFLPNTMQIAQHIGPIRARAERFYSPNRKIVADGSNFASIWRDFKVEKKADLIEIFSEFGREGRLFEEIIVEPVSKNFLDSPMVVSIIKGGKKFSIDQLGVGLSQALPILIQAAFTHIAVKKSSVELPLLLLQQPELHLHPVAQAAMGQVIFRLGQIGINIIVETHSDFLIDRYRACLRDFTKSDVNRPPLEAKILYFENNDSGNSFKSIKIDENGKLHNVPENYKEFFAKEFARTIF